MAAIMSEPELVFVGTSAEALSATEREAIPQLLGAAALAVSAPRQSGYSVQMAAINTGGNVVHGGNREYAFSASYVHGEEAVVSKLLSEHPNTPLLGLGVHGEFDPENDSFTLLCPCGNCRDVLLEEATPELMLVAGNERGATVARLSTFLCDVFRPAYSEKILAEPHMPAALDAARNARDRSVTTYTSPNIFSRLYGVALVDTAGNIFPGSLDSTASYDAVTPGVAAVQSFKNRPPGMSREVNGLSAVVIAGMSDTVTPLYRDRNAITELDDMLRLRENTSPTPVYIFGREHEEEWRENSFVADTDEWLPFPFTSKALGRSGLLAAKLEQLERYI